MKGISKGSLTWHKQLQSVAANSEAHWLVSTSPEAHLASYHKGYSPEEEFAELEDQFQWRGCACGS